DDTTGQVLRSTPNFFGYSTPTLVTTCPVQIDGIAIRPALSTFGAGSGPSAPNWITEPSTYGPGSGGGAPPHPGLPNVGHARVGRSIIPSYALLGSPCLFAIARGTSPPLALPAPFSVNLLLDQGTVRLLSIQTSFPFGGSLGQTTGATAPLPIPNVPAFAGTDLFAQVFAVEASGAWSASPGLRFTLF